MAPWRLLHRKVTVIQKVWTSQVQWHTHSAVVAPHDVAALVWIKLYAVRDHLQIIHSKSEMKRNSFSIFARLQNPFHRFNGDIRYGWICELGNIGTVCTVFKYVSLQKRYPKLLIKLGTDFEVGQKRKIVPFRSTFGTNNLETDDP
jgi:hypothetical protein